MAGIVGYCEIHPILMAALFVATTVSLMVAQVIWGMTIYVYVANLAYGTVWFSIIASIVVRKYLRNLNGR